MGKNSKTRDNLKDVMLLAKCGTVINVKESGAS